MKAQGSLEYLIIIAAVMAIASVVVLFLTNAFQSSASSADLSACRVASANCKNELFGGNMASCTYCEQACVNPSGKDLFDGTQGCGTACQQCKLGNPITQGAIMQTTLSNGLMLYLPLNETSGSVAYDLSGNQNNGDASAVPNIDGSYNYSWVAGKKGNALSLDYRGMVTIPASASLNSITVNNQFTVSAWINTLSTATDQDLIGFNGYPKNYFNWSYSIRLINGGRLYLTFQNASGYASSAGWVGKTFATPTVSANQWTFVALTYDYSTGNITCYVNGASNSMRDTVNVSLDRSNHPLKIGINGWSAFRGAIDEVRVYNRALTPTEINWLYTL
jgi:hypothetical protein